MGGDLMKRVDLTDSTISFLACRRDGLHTENLMYAASVEDLMLKLNVWMLIWVSKWVFNELRVLVGTPLKDLWYGAS